MDIFLEIGLWNAKDIHQRKAGLKYFIQEHQIDIFLINKYNLTNNAAFRIPGYTSCDAPHLDRACHAGSAKMVKSNSIHHEAAKFSTEHLQATL